jgi:hypothetical protein
MTSLRSIGLVAAGLVAAVLSLPAQGDTVQGIATVGKTRVALSHGMAVAYDAPDGRLVSVVLSDKPADAKAFAEATSVGTGQRLVPGVFEGAWKGQHLARKFSGVTFTIGPGGLVSEEFLVGGRNETFSIGAGEYVVQLSSRSPRLAGTIKTKAPAVDAGGSRSAGLDALFDLAVSAR